MANDASQLVELIRTLVREEIEKQDQTVKCVVQAVNPDKTIDAFLISDIEQSQETLLKGLKNMSRFDFKKGDIAILYKIKNNINNSFIVGKPNGGSDAFDAVLTRINQLSLKQSGSGNITINGGSGGGNPLPGIDGSNGILASYSSLTNDYFVSINPEDGFVINTINLRDTLTFDNSSSNEKVVLKKAADLTGSVEIELPTKSGKLVITEELDTKVDKVTESTRGYAEVYGIDDAGRQTTFEIASGSTPLTLVRRDSNGRFNTGTATDPANAINKEQFDEALSNKVDKLTYASGELWKAYVSGPSDGYLGCSATVPGIGKATLVQRAENDYFDVKDAKSNSHPVNLKQLNAAKTELNSLISAAQTIANAAQVTADEAKTNAATAQASAETAQSTADAAQTTATEAKNGLANKVDITSKETYWKVYATGYGRAAQGWLECTAIPKSETVVQYAADKHFDVINATTSQHPVPLNQVKSLISEATTGALYDSDEYIFDGGDSTTD